MTEWPCYIQEEVNRVQSGMSLDINLERSRVKEEVDDVLWYMLILHLIILQYGELHQKIKDTQNRIVTEVADLKMIIESHKLEMIKYLAGN